MNLNQNKLRELAATGKIRGFKVSKKKKLPVGNKKIPVAKSKAIVWLELNLPYWAKEHSQVLEPEYMFSPERKYRSDWALPDMRILIEYEGGIYRQRGAHNSPDAIQRDIDKYSLAHQLGYTVIRLTAKNYKTVFEQLNKLL